MTLFEKASAALLAAITKLVGASSERTKSDARIDALRGLAHTNSLIIEEIKKARRPTLKNLHIEDGEVTKIPRATFAISNTAIIDNVEELLAALKAQNEVIVMLLAECT